MNFSTELLNQQRASARKAGMPVPRMTVYRYDGFSRGDYHTYQVYFEFGSRTHIAGDFGGYDASEAKTKAFGEYLNAWGV